MKATITLDYEEFEHLKDLENNLLTKLREELRQSEGLIKAFKENKLVEEVRDLRSFQIERIFYNNPEEFFRIKELQEELKQKIEEASKKDDINNYRIIGFKIRKRG